MGKNRQQQQSPDSTTDGIETSEVETETPSDTGGTETPDQNVEQQDNSGEEQDSSNQEQPEDNISNNEEQSNEGSEDQVQDEPKDEKEPSYDYNNEFHSGANANASVNEEEVVVVVDNPSITTVKEILYSADMNMDEKLTRLSKCGLPLVEWVAISLIKYISKCGNSDIIVTDIEGSVANYNLFTTITKVCEQEDRAMFKVLFDIINMTFVFHAAYTFNPVSLMRFDGYWTWGQEKLS